MKILSKIDATDEHKALMADLLKCTFQVASFDKRFVRNVSSQINASGKLTEKQAALIYTMHYRYRRQHRKSTPNYDPKTDPKAHRNKTSFDDAIKLDEWNKASKR